MAGRFPLLTDEHISRALVEGLRARGWDVLRAVDVFGQGADDSVLFGYALQHGRVVVTTDRDFEKTAVRWMREWKDVPRVIIWAQEHQRAMSEGDFLREFDALAAAVDPLAYPVYHVKPRR
jgi:predicted nuclease of predicted toxin-antitoxin system